MSKEDSKQEKVIIYTTPWCQFCKHVEAYLDEKKIPYEKIDVQADQSKAKEMIDKSGQMGVPVTDIHCQIIVGWDKPKFEEILAK